MRTQNKLTANKCCLLKRHNYKRTKGRQPAADDAADAAGLSESDKWGQH